MSLLTSLGYTDVRHYPGGLAEWMESQPAPLTSQPAPRAPLVTRRAFASARLLDALADQTVGGLFLIWIEIVGVCGAIYWCLTWLPAQGLQTGGAPLRPDALGVLSAGVFQRGHVRRS